MKQFLGILLASLVLGYFPAVGQAGDCVEIDVEITPIASENDAGVRLVEFSVELTNCGTDPSLVGLEVVLATGGPQIVPPIQFFYPVGAGETIARSWTLAIPPVTPAGTYELCVTATSGEASDTDCATVEINDDEGASQRPSEGTAIWAAGSASDECVEVDVELTPVALEDASGLQYAEFSLELTNCGAEPALVGLAFTLDLGLPNPGQPFTFYVPVGAGETIANSWTLPIPPIVPAGTYGICVTASVGEATDSDCAEITIEDEAGASSLEEDGESIRLDQNYPNPFNIETGIVFSLNQAMEVRLEVYNILGERVATLTDGSYEPGQHTVIWDGRNSGGSTVATGVYFYRLTAGDTGITRKMILVK